MSLPSFTQSSLLTAEEICKQIADRVRLERRKLGLSQVEFASQCSISLRTYKRFELAECDSLETFIRIVKAFERITAIELLFPPKALAVIPRTAPAILERIQEKNKQKGN